MSLDDKDKYDDQFEKNLNFLRDTLGEEEFQKMAKEILQLHQSATFHIEAIKEEEDQEVLQVHVDSLECLFPTFSVKESIRAGEGRLSDIKDKCIERNLI